MKRVVTTANKRKAALVGKEMSRTLKGKLFKIQHCRRLSRVPPDIQPHHRENCLERFMQATSMQNCQETVCAVCGEKKMQSSVREIGYAELSANFFRVLNSTMSQSNRLASIVNSNVCASARSVTTTSLIEPSSAS